MDGNPLSEKLTNVEARRENPPFEEILQPVINQ